MLKREIRKHGKLLVITDTETEEVVLIKRLNKRERRQYKFLVYDMYASSDLPWYTDDEELLEKDNQEMLNDFIEKVLNKEYIGGC